MDNHPPEELYKFIAEPNLDFLVHQNSLNEKAQQDTPQYNNFVHHSKPSERSNDPNHGVDLALCSHQGTLQQHDFLAPPKTLDEHYEPHLGTSHAPLSCDGKYQHHDFIDLAMPSDEGNDPSLGLYLAPCLGTSRLDGDPIEVPDVPDTCFNYISDLLREDDLDENPGTVHDFVAFESYYKSLNDALNELNQQPSDPFPPSVSQSVRKVDDNLNSCSDSYGSKSHGKTHNVVEIDWTLNHSTTQFTPSLDSTLCSSSFQKILAPVVAQEWRFNRFEGPIELVTKGDFAFSTLGGDGSVRGKATQKIPEILADVGNVTNKMPDKSSRRKYHQENRTEYKVEERSSKQSSASHIEVYQQITQYEDSLFCPEGNDKLGLCNNNGSSGNAESAKNLKGSTGKVKKKGNLEVLADLRDLLSRCAQAVSRMDLGIVIELLEQIRQHSSPYGDSIQRVSHYFADGLEARLSGSGARLLISDRVLASNILKATRIYVAAVPFKIMSYYIANKTIATVAGNEMSLHIIDFGIFFGLQWPCIIYNLSKRDGGPPRLRITGVDFPQPGFRPAERLKETGRCLARYCERFNVPFDYHAIATKNWEKIKLEDLNISRDELLVVNCLYRSQHLYDESVEENSQRDAFLNLIKKIKPDYFVHGIVNGTFGVPVFGTRFREALFHYSALFDVFEATMPREDHGRLLLESKLYGKEILNVVAFEDTWRVERPETYKQWQVRQQRVGFRQLQLDQELLKKARAMVKRNFSKQFALDEDCNWAVQGWKGRILYAISCWIPT